MKKDPKNKEPKKHYFIIKVEGLIPAEISFRVLAETEKQAFDIYKKRPELATVLHQPKILPGKIKEKKIQIRNAMSNLITWIKNF